MHWHQYESRTILSQSKHIMLSEKRHPDRVQFIFVRYKQTTQEQTNYKSIPVEILRHFPSRSHCSNLYHLCDSESVTFAYREFIYPHFYVADRPQINFNLTNTFTGNNITAKALCSSTNITQWLGQTLLYVPVQGKTRVIRENFL